MSSHIIQELNRRAVGESRRYREHGEDPHFRLTCTSCSREATVLGRTAADKWEQKHRSGHINTVFIRREVVPC